MPETYASLKEVRDILDEVLDKGGHAIIYLKDAGALVHFHQRCNNARAQDRELNRKAYPPGDPFFGKSVYDELVFEKDLDENTLIIGLRKTSLPKGVTKIEFLPPPAPIPEEV